MARVHVSRPVPAPALEILKGAVEVTVGPDRVVAEAELIEGAHDADALLAMLTDRISAAVLSACSRLRVVANCAVGFNNVDAEAAARRGVWVTNTPNVLTETTADFTWALLLAVSRRLPEAERFLRAGRFGGWGPLMFLGADVHARTLGIVGMGRIGQAVARRAAGFRMRVVYANPRPVDFPGAEHLPLEGVLEVSDFVTVHVPLNETTRHLMGAAALTRMKPGTYLLNTSRGPVVDEGALARALREGRIAGAALDVFEAEPAVHPDLLAAPNAVLVPHIASATEATRTAMATACARDIVRVLRGETPENAVNQPAEARGPVR